MSITFKVFIQLVIYIKRPTVLYCLMLRAQFGTLACALWPGKDYFSAAPPQGGGTGSCRIQAHYGV
jgi:hypothetical protein